MQSRAIAGERNQVHHRLPYRRRFHAPSQSRLGARCILGSEAPLSRISSAFSSFFGILFGDGLPDDVATEFGYRKQPEEKPAPAVKPVPEVRTSDGALQMLSILQRDARLIDFLMEDISGYSDDQVGAAVRSLHEQ